jgi:hypothetical protein
MKDTTHLRGRLADGINESTFFVGYLNCAKKNLVSPVALARGQVVLLLKINSSGERIERAGAELAQHTPTVVVLPHEP